MSHKEVQQRVDQGVHAGPMDQPSAAQQSGGVARPQFMQGQGHFGMEREELRRAEQRWAKAERDGETQEHDAGAAAAPNNPLEGGLSNEGTTWFGALALPSISHGLLQAEVNGERVELRESIPQTPASTCIRNLISEGGEGPNVVGELLGMLPPRDTCDLLINVYFRDINFLRLPVSESLFRHMYTEVMRFRESCEGTNKTREGARLVPFLSALFLVFAIAHSSLPLDVCAVPESHRGALLFYHAARKCISVGMQIRTDHIDLVFANTLATNFCLLYRRTSEAWMHLGNAVRGAHAIGLHRDGSKLGVDARTTERRRRLWSMVFYLDRAVSILVGRPSAIQDSRADAQPPSDVPLDSLSTSEPARPSTGMRQAPKPTATLYLSVRHELARLMGKIGDLFQDLTHRLHYSDVLALDEQLEQFLLHLPPVMRPLNDPTLDRSMDQECPFLVMQRFLLHIEFNFVRITLHRPYVLHSDARYRESQRVAFATAQADRIFRDEMRRTITWPSNRARNFHLGGVYRLFNTTLIFGIMMLREPDQSKTVDYRKVLEDFVERHQDRTDLCTRREVQIVRLFLKKADEPKKALVPHDVINSAHDSAGGIGAAHAANSPTWFDAAREEYRPHTHEHSHSASTSMSGDQGVAQSLLNHLGGFGSNTHLEVEQPKDGMAFGMPDLTGAPYNSLSLSVDINRLDVQRNSEPVNNQGWLSGALTPNNVSSHSTLSAPLASQTLDLRQPSASADTGGSNASTGLMPQASSPFPGEDMSNLFGGFGGNLNYSATTPTQSSTDSMVTPWGGLIDAIVQSPPQK